MRITFFVVLFCVFVEELPGASGAAIKVLSCVKLYQKLGSNATEGNSIIHLLQFNLFKCKDAAVITVKGK